jgi:hypothetical protein
MLKVGATGFLTVAACVSVWGFGRRSTKKKKGRGKRKKKGDIFSFGSIQEFFVLGDEVPVFFLDHFFSIAKDLICSVQHCWNTLPLAL